MKYFNYSRDIKKAKSSLLLILFGFLLISCGGGGGGSISSGPKTGGGGGGGTTTNPLDLVMVTKGSVFGEFNFSGLENNENFGTIERIIIEYTTTNNGNYESSVDFDNNNFIKDTLYLENLISETRYYYRIMVHYANGITQEKPGNFTTNSIDEDGNGLIEIGTLRQLHNIRYDLKGTSYTTTTDNSTASDDSGCPNSGCFGYELTKELDFDQDEDSRSWRAGNNNGTIEYTLDQDDNVEPYFVVAAGGWEPIGAAQLPAGSTDSTCDHNGNNTCFDAIFEGNGHTIKNLAMSRDLQYLGMFGATGANADIRNLGLVANLADYTGVSDDVIYIGGLVGKQSGGSITASYTTGNIAGGDGSNDIVGGLVGLQDTGSITASYATGNIAGGDGSNDRVGGLVGLQDTGSITDSSATGEVSGGSGNSDKVGGLVGEQSGGGSITASYATGSAAGGDGSNDIVGGLVGLQDTGSITVSYATGSAAGGDGSNDIVGGLVGLQDKGSITASYATGGVAGGAGNDFVGGLVGEQSGGGRITASYATGGVAGGAGNDFVGGLVGEQSGGGRITASYATGAAAGADGDDSVGSLVGEQSGGGSITASYATGKADGGAAGNDSVGSLVGVSFSADIIDSYGFGDTVNRESAGNPGTTKPSGVTNVEELTLDNAGGSWNSTTNDTFNAWDFGTTNQLPFLKYDDYDGAIDDTFACTKAANASAANTIYLTDCGDFLTGPGQDTGIVVETTSNGAKFDFNNLRDFDNIDYISIYTTNDDGNYENFVDSNGSFTKNAPYNLVVPFFRETYYYRIVVERGREREIFSGDFRMFVADVDGNGLIEIDSLSRLHNMRYNLKGTSYKPASDDVGNSFGCPATGCFGYELTRDLDFDQDNDGSTWSASDNNGTIEYTLDQDDNAEPYFVVDLDGSGGWKSIGTRDIPFQAVFEGNGNTIKNLAMRSNLQYLGMFGAIGASADISISTSADISISNLGLVANLADYTGVSDDYIYVGGLVGRGGGGSITASYTTGAADGGAGKYDFVGGLVGSNGGKITNSYATGNADGGAGDFDYVGGLAGIQSEGSITASYATGAANGGAEERDIVGGLVGLLQNGGNITNSYATGAADGGDGNFDRVGGLVGHNNKGSITASYATGQTTSGRAGNQNYVGGLVGFQQGGSITASYATGAANGGTEARGRVGGLVGIQSEENIITASYATGAVTGGDGDNDIVGGLVGLQNNGNTITASYATGHADGGGGGGDKVGSLVGSQNTGGVIIDSYGFSTYRGTNNFGSKPSGVNNVEELTLANAGASWNSTTDHTFSAWDFGTTNQPPALKYADYDGIIDATTFACDGADNTATDDNTIYLPNCGAFLPRQGSVHISIDIRDGVRFDFTNSVSFTDITRISIQYTTTNNGNYESIVDTDNSTNFTKDTPYTVEKLALDTTYYYRIVVERGEIKEVFLGSFKNFEVDSDGDGLIDIDSLTKLHNMRYNLKGTSYKEDNKDIENTMGCPDRVCLGYELTRDLDFDQDGDGSTWSTSDADNNGTIEYTLDQGDNAEPYFVVDSDGSGGWQPIGAVRRDTCYNNNNTCFDTIFDGKGYTITALAMRSDLRYLGMFGATGASADIRNLGLLANLVAYTGNVKTIGGGLVGFSSGRITASYATGNVAGGAGGAGGKTVGGLVGFQERGSITASYATGNVAGGAGGIKRVGGLVGSSNGSITASYATGNVAGGIRGRDIVGGLVGYSNGSITASYATGNVAVGAGNDGIVGGLVSWHNRGSSITASYATGNVAGGVGERNWEGELVGFFYSDSNITASYRFGEIIDREFHFDRVNQKPSGVFTPNDLTLENTPGSWNSTTDHTFNAWDFGTTSQPLILKYADYDGTGGSRFACEGAENTITNANTIYIPYCGKVLPGQGTFVGVSINLNGAKFDFSNPRVFTDITRISIQYTTTNNDNYESSVDTDTTIGFNTNTSYTLQNLAPDTTYYYRIVLERGEIKEVFLGNFRIVEVDSDGNGLIDITSLTQLHNMRYNLEGTSYKTANDDAGSAIGCPNEVCRGYELKENLDFDQDGDGSTWSSSDSNGKIEYTLDAGDNAEPYFVVNPDGSGGWQPVGERQGVGLVNNCYSNGNTCFDTIFEGNGKTITSLASRSAQRSLGMFGATGVNAKIRNLGLLANLADHTGSLENLTYIGGLVGSQYQGSIISSYTTGNVDGGAGSHDNVGGLVGIQTKGNIIASYATGQANGGAGRHDDVGGLVGTVKRGNVIASYATGQANGGAGIYDGVGGLVGTTYGGKITASYATGNANGGTDDYDDVGGLIGNQFTGATTTASYAIGDADSGAGRFGRAGAMFGYNEGKVIKSYSFGRIFRNYNIEGSSGGTSKPDGVFSSKDLTLSNAGASWNSTTDNTFGAWGFGTTSQPPILKYADYDGTTDGSTFACEGADNTATDDRTIYIPYCGSFLSGQGSAYISIDISPNNEAKFDFSNSRVFNITRISIQYTTTNNGNYESSIDTDTTIGFNTNTSYTLQNLAPDTTYYYRIVLERGEIKEVFLGNFRIVEVDSDGNGLIDITSLTQLHNMRYNLEGTSYKTANDDAGSAIGCPNEVCRGYELKENLDFDQDGDGSTWSSSDNGKIEYTLDAGDNAEPYFVVNSDGSGGWQPVGERQGNCYINSSVNVNNVCFDTIFEGNGRTISSLAIRRDLKYLGMFGATGANADIRNLGLLANLTDYIGDLDEVIPIGGLVGSQFRGSITDSSATGEVSGGAGNSDRVGGLVGEQNGGSIAGSHTTGNTDGGAGNSNKVGGLVGLQNRARITDSYATGEVSGGSGNNDRVGGLVGEQSGGSIAGSHTTGNTYGGAGKTDDVGGLVGLLQHGARITDSYATGDTDGGAGDTDRVGGLVGRQTGGIIAASYATGKAAGGDGRDDRVGGLMGEQTGGSIIASYATGDTDGGAGDVDRVGGLVGASNGSITASYATGAVDGGAGNDRVGGLVGLQRGSGKITASYATGVVDGRDGNDAKVGDLIGAQDTGGSITDSYGFGTSIGGVPTNTLGPTPDGVTKINDLTLSNAGASWNSTTANTFRAWDFTTDQPPALKYADYDGASDTSTDFVCVGTTQATTDSTIYLPYCGTFLPGQGRTPVGGASATKLRLKFRKQGRTATGTRETLGHFALVDKDFDGYIEISNLVTLGNIIYNPQGTSYKTSTASKGITSGCPGGVCLGYELTRSFSTTELESGGVDQYLRNILTQDAVIKSNGYSIADIYFQE